MPGKETDGTIEVPSHNESKAYCEGMVYRAGGTASERPITDNPLPAGSPNREAWDRGWTVSNSSAGQILVAADTGPCPCRGTAVPI